MSGVGKSRPVPPKRFRNVSVEERRELLRTTRSGGLDFDLTGESVELKEVADALVESAVGYIAIPVGVVDELVVDGNQYRVPLATEEPSVIAAASYAARIIGSAGGFTTTPADPIVNGTVYLEPRSGDIERLQAVVSESKDQLRTVLSEALARMANRGGGLRSVAVGLAGRFVKLSFDVDVRDSMGANIVNSAAERAGKVAAELSGASAILSILTNSSVRRIGRAEFSIDQKAIPGSGDMRGPEIARRMMLATEIAESDPDRAVTHNKGIMNGITALALATGNDTRGVEAAAHHWASRKGRYLPLSRYSIDGTRLVGEIEVPLPLATTGGAASFHPAARAFLDVLGIDNAAELTRVAAAVGLAQNFAAVRALVSGGLQSGHMRLHARRLAFQAGARGKEIERVATQLYRTGIYNLEEARKELDRIG